MPEKRLKSDPSTSVVSERLHWLQGLAVRVEVSKWSPAEFENDDEVFDAIYIDVLPAGQAYFFVFRVGAKRRLIRTGSVVSMTEL
jgi:hypothetical protein